MPGILVDYIVEVPDQWQTTQTPYDPAISGEVVKPLSSFSLMEFGVGKVIARRVAQELKPGWAVNLGFGVSANVPRIVLEEGKHGEVTWVIEQGAVGGVPMLEFLFGCSSNAEAIVPSPYQFMYFQAAGFDCCAAVVPADRPAWLRQRIEARCPPTCDGGGGRIRRHHRSGKEDRVFRLLQCRRQDGDRGRQAQDRQGREGEEAG